jgi:hypothetical protein
MMLLGVDYHPSFQTIVFVVYVNGEYTVGSLDIG